MPKIKEQPEFMREIAKLLAGCRTTRKQSKIKVNEVSQLMKVDQPAVSRLESCRHTDIQLSTLVRYVEALEGEIHFTIKIGQFNKTAILKSK